MTEPGTPDVGDRTDGRGLTKALTPRAVISGFMLVTLFAVLAPINDGLLQNTFFYSHHLTLSVSFFIVVMGVLINPLLGRFRYRSGEMMVMVGMLLVLGGVASSGLVRLLAPVMAGPAKVLPTSTALTSYVEADGTVHLPSGGTSIGMPEHGLPDINDPEYRYVIDGFHHGFGTGSPSVTHRATVTWTDAQGVTRTELALAGGAADGADVLDLDGPIGRALLGQRAGSQVDGPDGMLTVVAVRSPAIPWGVWAWGLLAWTPLLASALVCFLAMAALVRHQWIHNERLTYPIANVLVQYLQDPEPGQRLSPVFRSRAFWVAFGVVVIWLLSHPLAELGFLPFAVPVTIPLGNSFGSAPFNLGYAGGAYLNPTIYFSIVGLAFFLPAGISFSVWFCFLAANAIYALLRHQGVAVDLDMPSKVSMGGWFVECLLILWIGRVYYMRLLRSAVMPTDDPLMQQLRPLTWIFLISALGLVLAMTALGAQVSHACVAALVYLGIGLVVGRLVAEAGLPFIQLPIYWNASSVIYSLTGFAAPLAALVPLTMLAQTLCADAREHLVPFATNAEFLAEKAGVRRMSWFTLSLLVVAIGTVVAGVSMLWAAYVHSGQQPHNWWRTGPFMSSLGPPAIAIEGGEPISSSTYTSYAAGAAVTGGMGIARLVWSWWPIHPIGILVLASWPVYRMWFAFFLGWLGKVLVMRYGGVQLYNRLKPVAYGLIAGEAILAGLFLVLGLLAGLLFDAKLPFNTRFLAG